MNTDTTYKIRPAGRHILTIGRELIQDNYAAVIELVKNAYDADSSDVSIEFKKTFGIDKYSVVISDNGHGMSRKAVVDNWMVPSTEDKIKRRHSPFGRMLQGSKGVGRYATSILGNDLLLETTEANKGEKTTVYVEWDNFEEAQYLDDVDILIETVKVLEPSGTTLTINGDNEFLKEWDKERFRKLRIELKKLIAPMSGIFDNENTNEDFRINLKVKGFPNVENVEEAIEPFPIFELYDYKISGTIYSNGKGELTYSSQKTRNIPTETFPLNFKNPTKCGKIDVDIRVYDRDTEAIAALEKRGLEKYSNSPFGKLTARQLLNHYNGIGVYRNGFRIRPLGDAGFDWLKLNGRRVNNPTLRISSNQVIGYVQIQSDDESDLIEKSARDGLRENEAFNRLQFITTEVISQLETRRYKYRRKIGLSQSTAKVKENLKVLFSSDDLIKDVLTVLRRYKVNKKIIDIIVKLIEADTLEKNKVVDEIETIVAIYQVEATLGKIVNVVLHEGRKPLSSFKEQISYLNHWFESYQKTKNATELEKIMRIVNSMDQNAKNFVDLFEKLDPLAARKRTIKKPLSLKKTIQEVFIIFEKEIESNNISVEVKGPDDAEYSARVQDIYAIFTNLIDNSIYWLREEKAEIRKITIEIEMDGNSPRYIDYHDTGIGIDPDFIDSQVIFEPGFTTKPNGTGLGLSIAGEAAERNDFRLEVHESDEGAHFRLQPKVENE